jgi:hypothetical protein
MKVISEPITLTISWRILPTKKGESEREQSFVAFLHPSLVTLHIRQKKLGNLIL